MLSCVRLSEKLVSEKNGDIQSNWFNTKSVSFIAYNMPTYKNYNFGQLILSTYHTIKNIYIFYFSLDVKRTQSRQFLLADCKMCV